jgi:anti-sigma B factor antagonist
VPRYRRCIDELLEVCYTDLVKDMTQAARNGELQRASVELLQWSIERSPHEARILLEGEIDVSTADALSNLLAEVLAERPSKVVVDLAGVSFLDSTGIKCLLVAQAAAEVTDGCKLVVRRPTRAIRQIFTICDVAETLLEDLAGDASVAH